MVSCLSADRLSRRLGDVHRNNRGGPSRASSPGRVNCTRIRASGLPDQWISRSRSMAASVRGDLSQRTFWPLRQRPAVVAEEDDHVLIRGQTGQNEVASVGRGIKLKFDVGRPVLRVELSGLELADVMDGDAPRDREGAGIWFQVRRDERRTCSRTQRDSLGWRQPREKAGAGLVIGEGPLDLFRGLNRQVHQVEGIWAVVHDRSVPGPVDRVEDSHQLRAGNALGACQFSEMVDGRQGDVLVGLIAASSSSEKPHPIARTWSTRPTTAAIKAGSPRRASQRRTSGHEARSAATIVTRPKSGKTWYREANW